MVWEQRYNGPGNLQDNAYKIKCDNSGNVYVTGRSVGNGSGYDFCTMKYTPDGSQVWIQRYNGPGNGEDIPTVLILDSDNYVYVGGYSIGSSGNFDFCILKYDRLGNIIFEKRYDDGYDDKLISMKVDNTGDVIVTGSSKLSSNVDTERYLTIKYNSTGSIVWLSKYDAGVAYPDIPVSLSLDYNKNVIITGFSIAPLSDWEDILTVKYDSSGILLWARRFSLPGVGSEDYPNSMAVDSNNNIFITGFSENFSGKMVTIKYSPGGNEVWYRLLDDPSLAMGEDIITFGSNLYVTGYSNAHLQVVKYNTLGELLWSDRINLFNPSFGDKIIVDSFENIYISGYCYNVNSTDALVVKYNSAGIRKWLITYNGLRDSNDVANDLCLDNFGNLYVTGWSRGFNSNADIITLKYNNLTPLQSITTEIPSQFSLSQNYPNPFNPSTKINFSIPKHHLPVKGRRTGLGHVGDIEGVKLKIFDILGNEVATLVNQQLTPGTYSVDWDASDFPSGIYFYRLTAGDFSQTNKVILLK